MARGSWNSFSTAQFSANSLDESDLEELNSDEEITTGHSHGMQWALPKIIQNPLKEEENIRA